MLTSPPKALLLLVLVATTTLTFAQYQKVTLKGAGKHPFISYETHDAIIQFDEKAFTNAFNKLENTFSRSRFEEVISKAHKAGTSIIINADDLHATNDQFFMRELIKTQLGAPLLKAGEASVFNKEAGRTVRVITYNDRDAPSTVFCFEGSSYPFFVTDAPEKNAIASVESTGEDVVFTEVIAEPDEPEHDENYIYTVTEESATYTGGIENLLEYFKKNLKNPSKCEGTVFISIVINKDGTTTDHTIVRALESKCDAEALRVIKESGLWIPGKMKGKPVRSKFIIPVKFKPQ